MAFSYKEQTYGSVTLRSSRYFDIDYSTLDYTPLYSTTQLEADKYVSDVGDTFKVTVGVTELDRTASGNSTLWVVEPSNDRVSIDTQHSAFTALSVTNDSLIRLTRVSKKDAPYVDYANAAVLTEQDLDAQAKQSLHIVQESIDTASDALPLATDGKWDGKSKVIKNVATPSDGTDAVNKAYADTVIDSASAHRDDALDHRDTAESYAVKTGAVVQVFSGASNNTSDTSPTDQAGVFSAKEHAVGTTVTTGSAKDWASKIDGIVASSDGSAKAWAIGGTGVTDTLLKGAAKEWATETSSTVDTSEYSAKEYAVGTQRRGQANGGSSKDWATYTSGTVDNADYSAKYWALDAEQSKLAAKASASAVANVYDNFSDTFLGSMADGATASSGTANGTWSSGSSSITLASTSGTIEVGQEVTGSGIPADANVLSIDGSTIVISENMTNAGSSVALTFTGQGVYGAFNSSSDGPSTDNDGDALSTGALYFNTTDNEMRIYDGANWIAASASGSTSFLIYKYVATGGQTTFTGNDANGASLSYTTNNIIVFLNGVKLDASDFTATSGTSVVLGSGATASDELVVVSFKSFTTADMVPASTGGTFSGNVSFGDNNITNVGSIALDSISADGSSITISNDTTLASGVDIETSTTGKIKQKGAFMQSSTHQALFLGY